MGKLLPRVARRRATLGFVTKPLRGLGTRPAQTHLTGTLNHTRGRPLLAPAERHVYSNRLKKQILKLQRSGTNRIFAHHGASGNDLRATV